MWIQKHDRARTESITIIYLLTKYCLNSMLCSCWEERPDIKSSTYACVWMWSRIRLTSSVDDIRRNILFSTSFRIQAQISRNDDANNRFHWSQSTLRNILMHRAVGYCLHQTPTTSLRSAVFNLFSFLLFLLVSESDILVGQPSDAYNFALRIYVFAHIIGIFTTNKITTSNMNVNTFMVWRKIDE